MTGIPDIAPIAAQAESRPTMIVRPIHEHDIRDGIAALDEMLSRGGPFDKYLAVVRILQASGMVSSRTEEKLQGKKKKEKDDVSPQVSP
jgi:hypothetical protein